MKCVKIREDFYVDGIMQKDVINLRADSWMESVVEGKKYIFHIHRLVAAGTDSLAQKMPAAQREKLPREAMSEDVQLFINRFQELRRKMLVDESNIPADEMREGKFIHGNSPLAQNMYNATQKEIEDFLRKKEAQTEFSLELNCNFSNGNSSFGFQVVGNLSRGEMQRFQDDLKELCNKYKNEE